MGAFDFILILYSFVYALAMAHLLSRVGALLLARERVVFSGLQALAALNALVLVYADWLTTWGARTLQDWDLASITIFFMLAVANYFVCVAAAPDVPGDGPIDLGAFYWKNRLLFWGMITALNILAFPANAVFGKSQSAQLEMQTDLLSLPLFVPCLLAIGFRRRWVQWLAGLGALTVNVGFLIVFSSDLR